MFELKRKLRKLKYSKIYWFLMIKEQKIMQCKNQINVKFINIYTIFYIAKFN